MKPNPNLVEIYERIPCPHAPATFLVVGCGLGDDAEWLAQKAHQVTAFDISPSAINECRQRFPGSPVHYLEADLLAPPEKWRNHFDVVLEAYTLQVLQDSLREEALQRICDLVGPDGLLILITRAREEADSTGTMPWPLTRREVEAIPKLGFQELFFEDHLDRSEAPPVRRYRACYRKSAL